MKRKVKVSIHCFPTLKAVYDYNKRHGFRNGYNEKWVYGKINLNCLWELAKYGLLRYEVDKKRDKRVWFVTELGKDVIETKTLRKLLKEKKLSEYIS